MSLIEDPSISYKNILCPVDFSDCSTKAFYQAVGFSQHFESQLVILNVREGGAISSYKQVADGRETLETLRKGLVQRLDLLQKEGKISPEERDRITLVTRNGKPYEEILRLAIEGEHDLIIMGTHGHTGFRNLFMGSQAERVVRRAPCAVLTVKPDGYDPKIALD